MRAKVAKALRAHAKQEVGVTNQHTTYTTEAVKRQTFELWDGKQFRKVPWTSYRTKMKRTCARAFYQFLKREFKANKLAGVA